MPFSEKSPGFWMRQEIASQAETWALLIPAIQQQADSIRELFIDSNQVIFSGCGSALNASRYGAPLLRSLTDLTARAVPSADIFLFPECTLPRRGKTTAVLLSRSGKTTEVIRAQEQLKSRGIPILAITCVEDSPLANQADCALILKPAVEQSVATTRSLTGMILTTQLLAAIISDNQAYLTDLQRLPSAAQSLLNHALKQGEEIGKRTDIKKYAFVANGPLLGLAHEAQLKVKETCLLPADAYPMLDFRHGPKSIADEELLLVALVSNHGYHDELALIRDIKELGAVTWAICDQATDELRSSVDYLFEFNSHLSDWATGPLYLPPIQYMAFFRSLTKGLNPDEPLNLSYWVNTTN